MDYWRQTRQTIFEFITMKSNYNFIFVLIAAAAFFSEILANFAPIPKNYKSYRLKNSKSFTSANANTVEFSSDNDKPLSGNILKLEINFKGENVIQNKYFNITNEAVELLISCYPKAAEYLLDDPEFMEYSLEIYDHGYYFRGKTLVGLIASRNVVRSQNSLDVLVYNVCVKEDERRNGIAKTMISEYLKRILNKKMTEYKNVYAGLSVGFTSKSAVSAFKLYAKAGFNRWWERCHGIHYFNFGKLDKQFKQANPTNSTSFNDNDNTSANVNVKDNASININDTNDNEKENDDDDDKKFFVFIKNSFNGTDNEIEKENGKNENKNYENGDSASANDKVNEDDDNGNDDNGNDDNGDDDDEEEEGIDEEYEGKVFYNHPMSKFMLNRALALKDNPNKDNLCMIMKWNDDDFDVIGRDIQNHILNEQKDLKAEDKDEKI